MTKPFLIYIAGTERKITAGRCLCVSNLLLFQTKPNDGINKKYICNRKIGKGTTRNVAS